MYIRCMDLSMDGIEMVHNSLHVDCGLTFNTIYTKTHKHICNSILKLLTMPCLVSIALVLKKM